MNIMSHAELIEFDDRGRAPLRHYGGKPRGRYLVETDERGVIHLYPALVMTEIEAAMWRERPADAARVEASLAHPENLAHMSVDDL
jgi:hypothetical protein